MGFFGSKATPGLCQALIALMPPHSVYIESHLGGGALMKRKRRQAATADRPALAACSPDHTPRTGFQNHRVFGNILK